jgi:hypothetical protein
MRTIGLATAALLLTAGLRAGEPFDKLRAPSGAEGFEIKLTVEEPSGLARKAAPASGGIPLPAATFKRDQPFAVFAGGAEVPAQVLPLVVDEKGFIRWLLVDLQADLGAKEKKEFALRAAAPAAKPAAELKVSDDASGVTVDTGKVKFTVAKDKPFTLLTSAEAGGKALLAGGEVSYTDGFDEKKYLADKPASVTVERAGAMRVTVSAKGRFAGDDANKFQYIARITAWAGRSEVHVKYTLANSNPDSYCYRRVSDSALSLKLAGEVQGGTLGASKPLEAPAEAWIQQSSRLVPAVVHKKDVLKICPWLSDTPAADGPGGAKAMAGDKELWTSAGKDDRAEGWVLARTASGAVWACDLFFVEDPPRKLALAKGALVLTGVTQPLEGAKPPFPEKQRMIFDCSHLSSEYVLDFAPPAEPAELSARVREVRTRPHVLAPPEWYFSTEAMPEGHFGTQADELACYDKWGWKYEKNEIPTGPIGQIAKIQRWVAQDDNHFTSEQDTLDSVLLMYLRTGGRGFYDAAAAWANYFMDLEAWRTDGWRWKDGGVWWHGGPAGSSPQRAEDPVTGIRNGLPAEWTKELKTKLGVWDRQACLHLSSLFLAKQCYCHNWGDGLAEWFLITGDGDALEAAVDCVEQNYDTQKRAFGKSPGKQFDPSRDFTRSSFLTNATRLCVPTDPFLVEASDHLAKTYLARPAREPRGFPTTPGKIDLKGIEARTAPRGLEKMKELGVTLDEKTGQLSDPKTGAQWFPLADPHTWMFPPLSRAMETYVRITGDEDARDWLVAYGQAAAHVLFQEKHGNLAYGSFLLDFPVKGFAWDRHSWNLPDDSKDGAGEKINGYLARFYPDVPARAYELCGESFLKKRAYDFWYYGSHRGYNVAEMHNIGKVGTWVNCYTTHDEQVSFTGKTFYIWAHERKDDKPPAAVADLKVTVAGDKATVSFTAPADEGGGKAVRYQVKCSDKPLVAYEKFLDLWKENKDATVTNWWMAANLKDEPAPQAPGAKESFTVSGVPANAKFFAVASFDDSSNRSAPSNVAEAGK